MKRKLKTYAKDLNGKRLCNPDVRPLDQRERPIDTRKGMIKVEFPEIYGNLSEYHQGVLDHCKS